MACSIFAAAQSRLWIWEKGAAGALPKDQSGVYGTRGTPSSANIPGSRSGATSWTGKSGRFWLFGGSGYDSAAQQGSLNDLWEFDPAANQWTWISGPSTLHCIPSTGAKSCTQPGVYGKRGVASPANLPGGRSGAAGWVDSSDNLWLFGGSGFDAHANSGNLNDLWEFSPSTGLWTWIGGADTLDCTGKAPNLVCGKAGVYGAEGKPASTNQPGGRTAAVAFGGRNGAAGWVDRQGNFWVYGGYGDDGSGRQDGLADLWLFRPSTGQWSWQNGPSAIPCSGDLALAQRCGPLPAYGTDGVPALANTPGARFNTNAWIDATGNLWLFGGATQYMTVNDGDNPPIFWENLYNDTWRYQLAPTP
ncbi:MAG: kelch repeat-containing protein [Terracidiphilus sp.]